MSHTDLVILIDALRSYNPEPGDESSLSRMLVALVDCHNSKRHKALKDLFTPNFQETEEYYGKAYFRELFHAPDCSGDCDPMPDGKFACKTPIDEV